MMRILPQPRRSSVLVLGKPVEPELKECVRRNLRRTALPLPILFRRLGQCAMEPLIAAARSAGIPKGSKSSRNSAAREGLWDEKFKMPMMAERTSTRP